MMMVSRPAEFFQPPYGLGMLIVIYGTFLEPTIAAYVMAKLSLGALPQNSLFRLLSFATLVLGAAGRFTLLLVNSFWVRQPIATAFLSTGQFFLETAVMAVLAMELHLWRTRSARLTAEKA